MELPTLLSLGLTLAGLSSSAGTLALAVRITRKDVNGLGKKLAALDAREDRRHREVVAALYAHPEPSVQVAAERLLMERPACGCGYSKS